LERVGEAEAVAAVGATEVRLAVDVGTGAQLRRPVRNVSGDPLGLLNPSGESVTEKFSGT